MSSLLRDIALDLAGIARHPRQWWHYITHTTCPVCGEELPAKYGPGTPWQAHKARHGQQAWRDALQAGGGGKR